MKRARIALWLTAVIGLCLLGLNVKACAQKPVTQVIVDSATAAFMRDLRDHFADHETVLCLYGPIRNDTAWIGWMRAAKIHYQTAVNVAYDRCQQPNPLYFGILKYLGVAHTHGVNNLPESGCYFSVTDNNTFINDPDAVIDIVICQKGLIARYR